MSRVGRGVYLGLLSAAGALSQPVLALHSSTARQLEAPPWRASTAPGVLSLRSPGSLMIRLPKTVFTMGSAPDEMLAALVACGKEPLGHRCVEEMFSDEGPARSVTVSSFWLDRTEVRVEDYARCVAARRCRPAPFDQGARRFDRPGYPVSLVSFEDAEDYCRFRGARLPTEAEFERAARGATGRRYPWGELWNSRAANHGKYGFHSTDAKDGFAELAPVGSFPEGRTPDGVEDLAGNVAEWVSDRYLPHYPPEDAVDPRGPQPPAAGSARVVRGGGFETGGAWLRGAARDGRAPATRSPAIGFRCARSNAGERKPATP